MSQNARHGRQTPENGGVHGITAFKYANAAARIADFGFDVNFDLYKVAVDLDTNLFWIIVSISDGLATWEAHGSGGAGLINISAGTTSNNLTNFVFSNSNNLSFGLNGSTITGSASFAQTVQTQSNIQGFSAGTTSANTGNIVFSNSNGISFGMNGNTITATVIPGAAAGIAANQAGTQTATSGTVVFANSNGLTFGMSGSSQITASYTVPSTAGLLSNVNVSAGTTSNNLSAFVFSNSNNVSFGLNGSTITATVTVPTQTNQSVGMYALGNTTAQSSSSTFDARSISFQGTGGISVGYSNGSVVISGNTGGGNGSVNVSAGTTSNNLTNFVFSNSNNVSFGLNGSTVTATITVPAQTNQSIGLYALGNTTQNSSTTLDARTLSFNGLGAASVGYSNGSIQVSVPVQTAQTQSNIQAVYDGVNSISTGTLRFTNANGVSFSINGQTISGSVAAQTNQSIGLYALGNTTQNSSTTLDARTLSFNGLGIVTAGYSNGSIQISATQSAQTEGLYAVGNTVGQSSSSTFDARTMSFSGAGIASVGYSGGNIVISVPSAGALVNISAGTTSNNLGAITFSNSNNVSFGLNGSTITASIPNQTIGLYALGNTTGQSSSSTFDARTMSFSGAGIASVGYSAGNVIISVPSAGALVNFSAGTTSNNLGAITFSNSNNVSFGLNGSTITASIPNQTIGLYALGNTTQNSSTTLDARTLSFNGLGIITAGYSNGSIQISATQSVQTAGLYAVGNTTAQSSSSTFDVRSLSFQGTGGVSVGYSNGSVVISGGAGGSVNISAGTTSNNLTNFVFSNSNNVSFGLNGSTVTATITVPTQTNQSVGLYALGNTTQNSSTTLDARTLSFNGLGAATVGYSNGSIQFSVPIQTVQTQSLIQAIYDGANSITTGTIRFTNANGVSFSINGQTISGSVAAQTAQTVGLYALGNTTQNSSTTLDARTLSFNGLGAASVGYSNGSIQISVPNALTNVNISAGTTSNNLTNFVFSNSNNVSFGLNGSTVTAIITVPTQTNQSVGLYALGNTTQNSSTTLDARTLSFNGLGAATVGYSNGSIQISVPTQTVQTQSNIQGIYDGANSISTGTIRFTNANGVSFSINGQTISGSVAAQTVQTVGLYALGNTTQNSSTTLDARTLSFNGLGIVTAGYSNGSIQISATQSAQTAGLYAVGNTVGQSSSSTFDARTLSFSGAGIASVGYSAGNVIISVPSAGALVNFSAGTTSNNLGAITFSNSNNVSFGLNGSTITASIPNQTIGLYAVSNTTGASSSSTVDARSISFQGAGIASVGYTNGSVVISVPSGGGGITNINLSAGTTSNNLSAFVFSNSNGISFGLNGSTVTATVAAQNFVFSNSNNITFGVNGSTITASASRPQVSQLIFPENPWQTNYPISNASFSLQYFNAGVDIVASQANLLMALAGNTNSTGAMTISLGIYTMSGSSMSLASSDSRVLTWTSGSQTTNSTVYGGISGTRYRTVSLNNWVVTAGEYMLGMWFRTTNDGTWNAFGVQGPTIVGAVDANETKAYLNGYSSSSFTTAMIGSINVTNTNYVRTGGNAFQQPGIIFLGTY